MALNERLTASRLSSVSGEIRAAYDDFLRQVGRAELAGRVLKVGDRMPGFLLPNAEGKLVSSDALLARGALAVTFFRGDWCPSCVATLAALEEALPAISAAGATLVALTPETGGRTLATKRSQGLHYEVLSDIDNVIAMQFGIVILTPERCRRLLLGAGIDLAERHGNAGWFLPMPAAFVSGEDGIISYAGISADLTQRVEPREIVEVLQVNRHDAA